MKSLQPNGARSPEVWISRWSRSRSRSFRNPNPLFLQNPPADPTAKAIRVRTRAAAGSQAHSCDHVPGGGGGHLEVLLSAAEAARAGRGRGAAASVGAGVCGHGEGGVLRRWRPRRHAAGRQRPRRRRQGHHGSQGSRSLLCLWEALRWSGAGRDAAATGVDLVEPLGFRIRLSGLIACVAGAYCDYRGVP